MVRGALLMTLVVIILYTLGTLLMGAFLTRDNYYYSTGDVMGLFCTSLIWPIIVALASVCYFFQIITGQDV